MAALWPVLRPDARTMARIGCGVLPDHGQGVEVQQVEPHAAALLP